MTDIPDDDTLRARGLYSTLQRERHKRLRWVQDYCRVMQGQALLILKIADQDLKEPWDDAEATIAAMESRIAKTKGTLLEIRDLNAQIADIKQAAWPEDK